MVRLFVHVAMTAEQYSPDNSELKKRIETQFKRLEKFLTGNMTSKLAAKRG